MRLGFDGAVKLGVPLPLDVRLPPLAPAGPAELVIEAPALGPEAGAVVTSTVVPFAAVPGAARAFHVPVVLADIRRPLLVRVRVRGREVLRREVAIDPARVGGRVVVALAHAPPSPAALRRVPGRTVVASVAPEELPRAFQEYAGIDLLVARDLDPARLDDAQRDALLTWIRLGGRLLLIPPPGTPAPAFLDRVLPATLVETGAAPTLAPRSGAGVFLAGARPVAASAPTGWGRVTVWAVDPDAPSGLSRADRLRLWAAAVGPPSPPIVDVAAAAARLPQSTPLDPMVHVEAGAAILFYVAALYGIGRRYPSLPGVVASIALVCLGAGVFLALARDARSRAATLTQATFLEQAPGTGLARAVTVAAVAVPYGGPFRVRAPRGTVAAPVAPAGDLRVEPGDQGPMLSGRLRPGEGARALSAIGAVPLLARAHLAPDGETLTVDLGGDRVRRAEVRWGDRTYLLGDLPPGASTRRLLPPQWKPLGEAGDGPERAWIFRGEQPDGIVEAGTPMLVGEIERAGPAFAWMGGGVSGRRLTILLVPLGPLRGAATRGAPEAASERR